MSICFLHGWSLLSDFVHNALNCVTGLVKGNILCVVETTLIFFPEALELLAGTDFIDNILILLQYFMTATLVCCSFQRLQQRFLIAFCTSQRIQNMYIVEISRTGIGDTAGQYCFDFFR